MRPFDTKTIEQNGRYYCVEFHYDDCASAPWENSDCHGFVSGCTTREKAPHEKVLSTARYGKRFYDVQASVKKAKSEGWGLSPDAYNALTVKLGKAPTRRQIVSEAVRLDYERLREWSEGRWYYIGIVVFPLSGDGDELRSKQESVWGLESDDNLDSMIHELISEIEA